MAKRVVTSVDRESGKQTRIATFELIKGRIQIEWASEDAELFHADALETIIVADGKFDMGDGKDYWNALPLAYAQSSNIIVKDL